ncbi:hypothetical protein L6452_39059 [Arctium lappa]|uniref:Uncharacterized protein n=1 Tax=Arctium lappa TaxID=4217 RepID=A0ACB8XR96_ARCLA|nr:hypothetical protein L6452_39059 [Arctium lappa]
MTKTAFGTLLAIVTAIVTVFGSFDLRIQVFFKGALVGGKSRFSLNLARHGVPLSPFGKLVHHLARNRHRAPWPEPNGQVSISGRIVAPVNEVVDERLMEVQIYTGSSTQVHIYTALFG